MQKKRGKIRKILLNLVMKVNENNKIEFYNFLGELLRYNSDYFTDYGYNPLLPKIKKYFTDRQLMEMEQYVLTNFCLGGEEKILMAFNVVAVIHEDKLIGRMYLTNMRIIGLGRLVEKTSGYGPGHTSGGLIGAVIRASKDSKRSHIRKALRQRMGSDEILFFGYQVPINDAFKIKKTSGAILYLVNLEEEKRNKIKIRRLKVKIVPKPMKREPSNEFKVRRVEVLNAIEQSLYNLQNSATVAPRISTPQSGDSQIFCPYCGKETEKKTKFCTNCGNSLIMEIP